MTKKNATSVELPISKSIEKLFLRFLVGKNSIYQEENYNDGLLESEAEDPHENEFIPESGWNQRVLLDVEKKRVERVEADRRIKAKRNAVLTRYFQQLLLKVINEKLEDTSSVLETQLQYRKNSIELLIKLLGSEPRYSVLATLLESNRTVRNRILLLVGNEVFMAELKREPRIVRDAQTAIGLIGTDVLRFLVPAILFKGHIDAYSRHNYLFAKKLWRYHMTLGQTCTSLMQQAEYRRPYEGMLLSAMVNSGYVSSYQEYIRSFDSVRTTCLEQSREKGDKNQYEFFFEMQTDSASLQALLLSKADLTLSLLLSEKSFNESFPHLVNALREEAEQVPFDERGIVGQILFKAIHFAKYEQLRASRLFKAKWLNDYLQESHLEQDEFKVLLRQELFRFKPIWA
jgi:hypothetical protein